MNNYHIYKVAGFCDDVFFIIYSRQWSGKRQYTLKRNAIHGCKGEMYDYIRKVGPDNFYVDEVIHETELYGYNNLSLKEAKKQSIRVKERERAIAINKHKGVISLLEDDIEELLNIDIDSKDKFINENKEKIKSLNERIQTIVDL